MMPLPSDYLERVYAGVLGKVIGVLLGRPFEGWPRAKILSELGHVRYYVHEKVINAETLGFHPLIIIDDDISATFMLVRALEEHIPEGITAVDIGKTWLNNTVEDRSVFSWGGRGYSTEHTAYLNLKSGIPGGLSGAIETNGKTIAEQVGGEIFIDAFAMCTPGNPELAAKLVRAAASVSHGGEGVYGAIAWACMEAEAFTSKDISHLIEVGLKYIPQDSLIAESTREVVRWAAEEKDWENTLQRIEHAYGKCPGACSIIPNHAIKIMSLLYGGHSFHEGIHIIVTCGWDTDSNGGNVGALLGIMHGIEGFENGPDWRGPLADKVFISSADPGYSINNCSRLAYDITNLGRKLHGDAPLRAPKNGAQYHFSLPGSTQGFRIVPDTLMPHVITLQQGLSSHGPALAILLKNFSRANKAMEIMTETFMPERFLKSSHYTLQGSPILYPGQKVEAVLFADSNMTASGSVHITLQLKTYGPKSSTIAYDGPSCSLSAGEKKTLRFTVPDTYHHQPIKEIGFAVSTTSTRAVTGTIWIDYLRWSGSPRMKLCFPTNADVWPGSDAEPWRRAWVNSATTFSFWVPKFAISQSQGEGGIFQGCRDWFDYRVTGRGFVNNTPGANGIVVRFQGLRRWYAMLLRPGKVVMVKALDEQRLDLASCPYDWKLDIAYDVTVLAEGNLIRGFVNGEPIVEATDDQYASGGIGFLVTDGSASVESFDIEPSEC